MLCKKRSDELKHEEILKRILVYFGQLAQEWKLVEVGGELISAIAEMVLKIGTVEHVIEECADYIIVASQLTLLDTRSLEVTYDVSTMDTIKWIKIGIENALELKDGRIDAIKTSAEIIRRFAVQLVGSEILDEMIEDKLERTIDYIESGKYFSNLA